MKIKVLLDRYRQSKNEIVLAKIRVRKIDRDLRACHKKWRREHIRWESLKRFNITPGPDASIAIQEKHDAKTNCTKVFPGKVQQLHVQLFNAKLAKSDAALSACQAKEAIRQIQAGVDADLFDDEGRKC